MDTPQSDTKLAQNVRTFAQDLRRAQARGDTSAPTAPRIVVPPLRPATPTAAPQTPITTPNIPAAPEKIIAAPAQNDAFIDIKREVNEIAPEGVFVRDTKRKQWSLGKALSESFSAWVNEKKEEITEIAEKKDPKPTVAPSALRKDVIQEAKKESTLAPKDDRGVVVEKLRTFASDTERATGRKYITTRTPTAEELAPRWSSEEPAQPVTQPAKPDLRAVIQSHTQSSTPPIKQARPIVRPAGGSLTALPHIPLSNPFAKESTTKSLTSDVAPTTQQGSVESAYVKFQRAQQKKAEPIPYGRTDDVAPKAPSRDLAFEKPEFAKQETQGVRTYRADALTNIQENKLSVQNIAAAEATRRAQAPVPQRPTQHAPGISPRPFVIAGIIIIFIIAIGGFGFFWYAQPDVPSDVVRNDDGTVRLSSFMSTDRQQSIPFSTNRATLLDELSNAVTKGGTGVTQIYPIADGETAAVPTSRFMFVLDPRAPASFLRNLDEQMMFGSFQGNVPFFIFKTKQFDTAFAGMLDWEQYMSADLTPLFGDPVTYTLDVSLRTIGQSRSAFFVDDTFNNIDTRILYDETGTERIVYAFLDRETLIITTSTAMLSEAISRMR
jgi:hypothetical protein